MNASSKIECWCCSADLDKYPPENFRRDSGEPVSYCPVCEAYDPWDTTKGECRP